MERYDSWQSNFEALKAHVAKTGYFPNKHTRLNNWCRYQRKRIKNGIMPEEQQVMFEELAASRSKEHTGGRKKASTTGGLGGVGSLPGLLIYFGK